MPKLNSHALRAALCLGLLGLLAAGCNKPANTNTDGGGDTPVVCDGQPGCACIDGACTTGECINGSCVDCRRGEDACICRANGTCNAGLRCNSATQCETCPPGESSCGCLPGDVCGTGLVCSNGTCVVDTCAAGTTSCPCRSSSPKCDGDQYCDTSSICQTCSADVAGCACGTSGVCLGGLVCESGTNKCRAPLSCDDLVTSGQCVANQECTQTIGADAVCTPNTCVANYKWDTASSSCVSCVSQGCANEPTCATGDAGIGDSCTALNRSCSQVGLVASCSSCLPGYTQPFGVDAGTVIACIPVPTCGTTTCSVSEFCDTTTGTPTCVAIPCGSGQVQKADGGCAPCNLSASACLGTGFSGRHWPKLTNFDVCICETLDGYFLPAGGASTAEQCDADHDGWVREEADDNLVHSDPAILANSRCQIRKADRVRLVDEFGVGSDIVSCATGLLQDPDAGACTSVLPLRLLEKKRNDVPDIALRDNTWPSYGQADAGFDGGTVAGRFLDPNELNSLTKACVSVAGDYNANGKDDMSEVQAVTASSDDRVRLESFAYFMELYTSYYVPPVSGQTFGTLVIKERSRCAPDFPLRYDASQTNLSAPTDQYTVAQGKPYWRNCSRARDPQYNQAASLPGFDFAQWDCSSTSGSCAVVPPGHATLIAPTDPATTLLRNFGVCELYAQSALPKDGRWRGMQHHSQFKCVNVQNTAANSYDRVATDFGGANNLLTFNQCVATQCGNGVPCSTTPGTGVQTAVPSILCRAQTAPALGAVGFAAVNYRPYRGFSDPAYTVASYQGGCINEDDAYTISSGSSAPATYTCPYPEFSLVRADADANFGRFSCWGKGSNFLWCDSPCTPVRATLRYGLNSSDTANGVLR